jgi:hypothetical protein
VPQPTAPARSLFNSDTELILYIFPCNFNSISLIQEYRSKFVFFQNVFDMSFIDSKIYQVRLDDWRNGLGILARAGNVLFPSRAIPFLMPTFCVDGHEADHSVVYNMEVHANVVFHSSSLLVAQFIELIITALT